MERVLLGDSPGGTWAERVARLFTLLCRACELEAVPIPGYWKSPAVRPGTRTHAHNHCWAGVKVNGRWRLVDPVAGALAGGHVPFFVPPDAFIYSYWPLEAAWQLLPEPLSLDTWWALPYASVAFFARGCQLGDERIEAVNELPPIRCVRVPHAEHMQQGRLRPVGWPGPNHVAAAQECHRQRQSRPAEHRSRG